MAPRTVLISRAVWLAGTGLMTSEAEEPRQKHDA